METKRLPKHGGCGRTVIAAVYETAFRGFDSRQSPKTTDNNNDFLKGRTLDYLVVAVERNLQTGEIENLLSVATHTNNLFYINKTMFHDITGLGEQIGVRVGTTTTLVPVTLQSHQIFTTPVSELHSNILETLPNVYRWE